MLPQVPAASADWADHGSTPGSVNLLVSADFPH
jgi:hypothetical protein